jgi:hypothetical protein
LLAWKFWTQKVNEAQIFLSKISNHCCVSFRLVAIAERSANLFRATISALTGRNPAQRFRSPDGEQNRKIFLTFFNCAPPKFFSIKETKIFLFCLPADAEIAEKRFPTHRRGERAKIHFPQTPFSFCPLAFGLRPIFSAGFQNRKGGGWG